MKLTRAKLEALTSDLIEKTFEAVKQAIKDAKIDASKVDEIVLVGGQTRMPAVQEKVKSFFGKEAHKGINPDEVVAVGAAIQGAVLAGEMKEMVLLDVTPLSLGVETLGGVSTVLIARNTTIPTEKTEIFSTAADNQTSVEINVLQGERPMAADNKSLGRFILDGVPPAPRGVPQIEVAFDIDANGILNVSAKDKATGKEQKITITGSTGLSKEESERMAKEAEAHAEEDKKKKELIEARNIADALVYTAEKSIKDAGDKLPAEVKTEVEEKIKASKEAIAGEDLEKIKKATDELGQSLQKIGSAMYQTPPGSDKTAAGPQEEIKEGEEKKEPVEGEVVDEGKNSEK
jgi:molecular chaperone DnaK